MSNAQVRGPSAPWPFTAHDFARRICTSNPFYVISAGLFLVGLRISFGPQADDLQVGALLSGLAGYTLLLAVTALVLVRFGNVWDDVRTVLLLVVLMFLATSVTFDGFHVDRPLVGVACDVTGFVFAVIVTEIVLRVIRLRLPNWFRGPYYLILGLFFLYPAALTPFVKQPNSEILQWGLFSFSAIAGLAFLTLIPAVRLGPDYVADNGSPWGWPLYPWVVFGMLALAVPARAWLLCYSMHWLDMAHGGSTIFGMYFLAPFILCLALLLLEIGLAEKNKSVTAVALLTPFAAILASMTAGGFDQVYAAFLRSYRDQFGDPFHVAIIATAALYGYAALRRVEGALGAMTGMLVVLTFVGPHSYSSGRAHPLQVWPIVILTLAQLGLGLWRRQARHWGFAATGAVILVGLATDELLPRELSIGFALHAGIFTLAAGGAVCQGLSARAMRHVTAGLFGLATILVMTVDIAPRTPEFARIGAVYPLLAATFLACYGALLGDRAMLRYALAFAGVWVLRSVSWIYLEIRRVLPGLDWIVGSLALFVAAFLVSLIKAGRWPPFRAAPIVEPTKADGG